MAESARFLFELSSTFRHWMSHISEEEQKQEEEEEEEEMSPAAN